MLCATFRGGADAAVGLVCGDGGAPGCARGLDPHPGWFGRRGGSLSCASAGPGISQRNAGFLAHDHYALLIPIGDASEGIRWGQLIGFDKLILQGENGLDEAIVFAPMVDPNLAIFSTTSSP